MIKPFFLVKITPIVCIILTKKKAISNVKRTNLYDSIVFWGTNRIKKSRRGRPSAYHRTAIRIIRTDLTVYFHRTKKALNRFETEFIRIKQKLLLTLGGVRFAHLRAQRRTFASARHDKYRLEVLRIQRANPFRFLLAWHILRKTRILRSSRCIRDNCNRDGRGRAQFAALIAHKPSFQMGRNCVYVSIIRPSD